MNVSLSDEKISDELLSDEELVLDKKELLDHLWHLTSDVNMNLITDDIKDRIFVIIKYASIFIEI